jgi:hypothetical protein
MQPPIPEPSIAISEVSRTKMSEQLNCVEVEAFNPGWRFFAAFGALGFVNLAAALDATTISVALPVCPYCPYFSLSIKHIM